MKQIYNAEIKRVFIGYEGHGILTCSLEVSFDGYGQSFGLMGHGKREMSFHGQKGDYPLAYFVSRLLDVIKVDDINKLIGRPCRVQSEGGLLRGIGNFISNEWFFPAEDYKKFNGEIPND